MAFMTLTQVKLGKIWTLFSFILLCALVVFMYISHLAVDKETLRRRLVVGEKDRSSSFESDIATTTADILGNNPTSDGDDEILTSVTETTNQWTNDDPSYKRILFWTNARNKTDFGISTEVDILKKINCSVYQCSFTTDQMEIDRADAVMFNGFGLHRDDLPERTRADQIFVFYMYESPSHASRAGDKLATLGDVFNLTFTYLDNPDTDIFAPLGRAYRRAVPKPVAIPSARSLKTKTKLVLWIVSNCYPHSVRMEYAKELQKYVPVDVYGDCGNHSCGVVKQRIQCMANLSKSYMFYLAFENSYCTDYYTEKALNPLHLRLVPITLGGANYTKYLPPNSFLDVRRFSSPEHLAKRLRYLQKSVVEYRKHFWWRQFYEIKSSRQEGFCRLCEILHTSNYTYKSNFNVAKYWDPEKRCLSRTEQFRIFNLL